MSSEPDLVFPPFRLDLAQAQLWRGTEPVPLRPRAFAVLHYLVTHTPQLVTRAEVVQAVWGEAYVSEGLLRGYIRDLRAALRDEAQAPRFIATVGRRGWRFLAPVTSGPPPSAPPAEPVPPVPTPASASAATRVAPVQFGVGGLPPVAVRRHGLLVGREAEMAQLQQWWVQARQGERQVVLVTGEAGIGKTTLVDAFVAQVAATAVVWLGRGQCIEHYGAGEAYLPLLEALGQLGKGPEGAHLVELLRQQAPSWLLQMPALVPDAVYDTLQRRGAGVTRERMLRELAEAMEVLTAERPLVLVLEDLHWSDSATLDWLAFVAHRRGPARLLVLGTYRPADALRRAHPVHTAVQELQRQGQATGLSLAYLTETDVAAYLVQRFGTARLPEGLAPFLHQHTTGNPFFLVTMVEALLRQEVLVPLAEGWTLSGKLETVGVPESIRQVIEQQLAHLSTEECELLAAASVAGGEFWAATVAAALGQTIEQIEARCDTLARRGQCIRPQGVTIWPDGTVAARYGFIHDLYHAVIYDHVPASRLVRWHGQIGARLEAGYGPQACEVATELAAHFVRGHDPERAVQYLWAAGERALQRSAQHEAIAHLTQGLALLEQLPDTPQRAQQELRMQTALGPALMTVQGFGHPDVERVYTRARALCQQVGDTPQLFPVLSGLWRFANGRAQHQQAWELGTHLLGLAQQSGDPALVLQAHHALWTTAYNTGAFAAALQQAEHGLALYTPAQHHAQTALYGGHDPGACGRSYASHAAWFLGYLDQATQWNDAALALAQALAHPFSLGHTLMHAAMLHELRRDGPRTYEWAQATLTVGREQASHYLVAYSTVLLGWALAVQGRGAEGMAQIQQGLRAWQAVGTPHLRVGFLLRLAEASGTVGRVAEGLTALAEALTVGITGAREAEWYRVKGDLLWQSGSRPEEAEACFQQALTIARRQQAKSLELRAAMGLSRLWQHQGKRAAAYALLAPIYGWFTEGFDTVDLQEARALLEELS